MENHYFIVKYFYIDHIDAPIGIIMTVCSSVRFLLVCLHWQHQVWHIRRADGNSQWSLIYFYCILSTLGSLFVNLCLSYAYVSWTWIISYMNAIQSHQLLDNLFRSIEDCYTACTNTILIVRYISCELLYINGQLIVGRSVYSILLLYISITLALLIDCRLVSIRCSTIPPTNWASLYQSTLLDCCVSSRRRIPDHRCLSTTERQISSPQLLFCTVSNIIIVFFCSVLGQTGYTHQLPTLQ